MYGFSRETHARVVRLAVAGVLGFGALVTGEPAQAALSESGFPAIQMRQEVRPQEKAISSDQVAIAQYNTGHRAEAVRMWQTHAEKGDAEAQFTLGVLYNRGDGALAKDMIQAVHWYRKAAERGHAGAHYSLARLYEQGQGVPKDLKQSAEWRRKGEALDLNPRDK